MASKYFQSYVNAFNKRANLQNKFQLEMVRKKRAIDKAKKKQDKAHKAYLADVKKRAKKRRK